MSEPIPRPAIAAEPISVILFARAAADTEESVRSWQQHLQALKRPHEISLIQETRLEVPTSSDPSVRVFSYDRALGFRDAVAEAIRTAQHPLLVFCTADKQYSPADLAGMLKLIDQVDLVVGYRTGRQAPPWRVILDMFEGILARVVLGVPPQPRLCWLGSQGWGRRLIARWIFGVRVHDPECPFRLARRSSFERIPLQSGGPFLMVEMLAKANQLSLYFAESPVTWSPPEALASDAITFAQDARLVFHHPEFA